MAGYWCEDRNKLLDQPDEFFRIIKTLEGAIRYKMIGQIFEALNPGGRAEKFYATIGASILPKASKAEQLKIGRNAMLEIARMKWSVEFALHKLALYKLGVIRVKKDGDLRTSELLPSDKQALNFFRWKRFRENPQLLGHIVLRAVKIGGSSGKSFLRKLAEIIAKPALAFNSEPETPREKLQSFILKFWACDTTAEIGEPHPALCDFTDEAMLDYLQNKLQKARELGIDTTYLDAVENMDVRSLRAVWERLGLHRPKRPFFRSVQLDRSRRNPLKTGKLLLRNWK